MIRSGFSPKPNRTTRILELRRPHLSGRRGGIHIHGDFTKEILTGIYSGRRVHGDAWLGARLEIALACRLRQAKRDLSNLERSIRLALRNVTPL